MVTRIPHGQYRGDGQREKAPHFTLPTTILYYESLTLSLQSFCSSSGWSKAQSPAAVPA